MLKIETNLDLSLPSWECGLKFAEQYLKGYENVVAPFVGVWIEITSDNTNEDQATNVAPFVGVWIEIF